MRATIYFSGSISGGRGDVAIYREIVDALERDGHRVLAGSVAEPGVTNGGESGDPRAIFSRDIAWIADADVVVAEVSMPSLGVGYEIAAARYRFDIPVIAMYRAAHTARCSAMIAGDEGIELIEYEDLADAIERVLLAVRNAVPGPPVTAGRTP